MRKSYSPEFKAKAVREILKEEKTLRQMAAAYKIHPNLAAQVRDQALVGLVGIFSRARESDLFHFPGSHHKVYNFSVKSTLEKL